MFKTQKCGLYRIGAMFQLQKWDYVYVVERGLCLITKYSRCMQAAKIRFPNFACEYCL